ncbi:MAG TPA: alpha/beta fold hydrolase [Actinomycetes bacterium]|nr:alpha/beta fold hydrolase [Actinomycetes bacterium]
MGPARVLSTLLRPRTVRGLAVEVAWVSAHLALYPLGVAQEQECAALGPFGRRRSLRGLTPLQRGLVVGDVEAAGTPILLVHGMVDNRSIFALLRRSLLRRGFGRVATMNYRPAATDVREVARELALAVEALCAETGYERVHVVGHSLGGLVARYYVQRLGGDERVHTLVTLGTPHHGSAPARLVPHPLMRQLRPGSALLTELAEPAVCRTRFVAVWSDADQMVLPWRSARIDHPDLAARNVLVPGVGHMSLPIDRRVVHEVSTTLAHLSTEGATVTAGVSRLETGSGTSIVGASTVTQTAVPNRSAGLEPLNRRTTRGVTVTERGDTPCWSGELAGQDGAGWRSS